MLVFVALERATGITSMQLKCFVFPASTPLQVLSAHYSTWSIIVTKKKCKRILFHFILNGLTIGSAHGRKHVDNGLAK